MVELDVRDDGDLRPQPLDGAVGLVALDDEPALPRAGVAAELRDLAADEPGRVEAELGSANAIIPVVVVLPCAPGDDDRTTQRDELGEEVGARRAGDRSGYALETTTSQPSGMTGSAASTTSTPSSPRR